MKIAVIFFTVIFLLVGCGSKTRVAVEKQELPSWYTNTPKTTSETLYCSAEGKTKEEAVANALSAMVATLNVAVSSELNIKSVVKEGAEESYHSITTSEVNSSVKNITISEYEILNYMEYGFKRHLVEIKSDKKKLFNAFEKELKQRFIAIQSRAEEAQKLGVIKELFIYRQSVESTADVKNIVAVMGSLKPEFAGDDYINKVQELQNRYSMLMSKITFSVISNNDAVGLKSVIGKGLSQKKYIIQNIRGKYHFTIYIESDTQRANSYGFELARSAISITVKDSQGAIIGSNKLNITGQSTQGYRVARESVAVKLNEMVKKEGIDKIIGLDI